MVSWFIKQPKIGQHVSDIGVGTSAVESHGPPAVGGGGNRVRKYRNISWYLALLISLWIKKHIHTVLYVVKFLKMMV
jgi:hypothetical protein